MVRFHGFDGLRGWLAWAVVAHHLTFFTGLQRRSSHLSVLEWIGSSAVTIFIFLSGFVITHLIIERPEPYRVYIARRLLRVYPIYLVALGLACVTTLLTFDTFLSTPAQTVFIHPQLFMVARDAEQLHGWGALAHLGLHLALLHGAIPTTVLPDSQFMFLAPAWSLSLEFQFYLVAPLVIWAACRKLPSILIALAAMVLFQLAVRGAFGAFVLPSFLPAAAPYFAIGIVSRLLLPHQQSRGSPIALAILLAGYLWGHKISVWLPLAWAAFLLTSLKFGQPEAANNMASRAFRAVFDSRLANHLGKPSYSTYLLHMPMIQLAQFLAVRWLGQDIFAANAFVVIWTVVSTYGLSQLAYRWIETPSIEAGRRLGRNSRRLTTAIVR